MSKDHGVAYFLDPSNGATPEELLNQATLVRGEAPSPMMATPPPGHFLGVMEATPVPEDESPRTLLVTGRKAFEPAASSFTMWSPSTLTPGRVLSGRYRIEEVLGSGGTSLVFRATDLSNTTPVALKVFNLPGNDEKRVARFKQEFRLAREMVHPNIVRLLDVASDGDFHFLAMELLKGETLKSAIPKRPSMPEALRYLTHATVALEYAHKQSVIHRDVKPANLFITQHGIVKLMDFGLAMGQTDPRMTATGALLGTPEYMAPEQITGEHVPSPATDLYSLGVVAYELFTGQAPFKHSQLMPLLFMHVKEAPRSPRDLNPLIPVELEAVILKLLEKAPASRFQSAAQLRLVLRDLWPAVIKSSGAVLPRSISSVP